MVDRLPPIETSVYRRLDWQVRHLLSTAGLGIARGPVGIGKTHSIATLSQTLRAEGVNVVTTCCTATSEGSYQNFVKTVLSEHSIHHKGMVQCMEAFEMMVMGEPFGYLTRPSILIVDECQGMRAPVLNMLRQLWDRGDEARRSANGQAFALLLCGNYTFMNRSGVVREMDMHPLRDRVTINARLEPPEPCELEELAKWFCPDDRDAATLLAKFGKRQGNPRAIERLHRTGRDLAGSGALTAQHLRDALTMMGNAQ